MRCHPEGPRQAQEVGPCELHEVQQGQVQGPAHGSGQPPVSYQCRLGDEGIERSPEEKDLGVLLDEKLDICSPEGQPYPGLHQEKHSQQVKGGESSALLCSGETSPGVLRPAPEPSEQERQGAVGAGPEEATKIIQGLEHLSSERLRVGAVQPGEEKAPGRPYSSLPVPEGAL